MSFPNCKTANCVAVQIQFGNGICMCNTDICIDSPLIDSKKQLFFIHCIRQTVQSGHLCLTALQPSGSAIYRSLYIFSACHTAWTFVKCHGNGRAQIRLDLHTLLWSHKNLMTVNMGLEINALFLDLTKSCQGKHLKAAGISENRSVPDHKFVKSAKFLDQLVSCSYMEMIGIGKLNLSSDILQIHGGYCTLDGSNSSYVHKHRCLDGSMYCLKLGTLGTAFCFHKCIFCHM